MGGTDGFSEEHPSGGGRGSGRGFSLFMGRPSHISPQQSHRSWIIHQRWLKIKFPTKEEPFGKQSKSCMKVLQRSGAIAYDL